MFEKAKKLVTKQRVKRSNAGFTFVEMLVSLLIIVMITTIVASSVPTAFNAYRKAVDGSNAQVALSTTTSELRSELSYALDVDTNSAGKVLHYRSADGYWASIDVSDDHKSLVKTVYAGDLGDLVESGSSPLLSDASITENLNVTFSEDAGSGIYYDDGVFSITGLNVIYEDSGKAVAEIGERAAETYKVRAMFVEGE